MRMPHLLLGSLQADVFVSVAVHQSAYDVDILHAHGAFRCNTCCDAPKALMHAQLPVSPKAAAYLGIQLAQLSLSICSQVHQPLLLFRKQVDVRLSAVCDL